MEKDYIQLYDQACKELIAKKPVISLLCKHTIEELKDYSFTEVQDLFKEVNTGENRELDNKSLDYKNTITLRNGKKLIINVEFQNDEYPGYDLMHRAVYYSALLITTQDGNYKNLKKVYSIWIIPHSSKKKDGLITETKLVTQSLTHSYHYKSNLQTIIMLYMNDQHDIHIPYKKYDELLMPLLLMFTGQYKHKNVSKLLKEKYKIEGIEKEEENMCNLGEGLAKKYHEQGKLEGLQEGKQVGLQEGKQEGFAQGEIIGISKGSKETQLNNLKKMMKNLHCSLEEAMSVLEIDLVLMDQYEKLIQGESL